MTQPARNAETLVLALAQFLFYVSGTIFFLYYVLR